MRASIACLLYSLSILSLAACSRTDAPVLQGYVEGEFVRVASPYSGTLTQLTVTRGAQVSTGGLLFTLEQNSEQAARAEANARLSNARARLTNLQKGKRPDELAAAAAQLSQAQAAWAKSQAQFQRDEKLVAGGFISRERLDQTRATRDADQARVAEMTAQLKLAHLGARSDEVAAAEADVKAAQAALDQAQWRLDQKSIRAPESGLVHDTLYVPGEWVPAGSPVVSLLPPANLKVRFFIPEPRLARIKVGQRVSLRCDGCPALVGTVSYISPKVEYTPPVIYSIGSRAKLVYLAEAGLAPEAAAKLHPGQPIDIILP